MPCRDEYAEAQSRAEARRELEMLRAVMCGLMPALESHPILDQKVDWEEAGVTKAEFLEWWENHKAIDARRRAEEKRRAKALKARERALAKLSPKDLAALGLTADGEDL